MAFEESGWARGGDIIKKMNGIGPVAVRGKEGRALPAREEADAKHWPSACSLVSSP